MNIIFVDIDGTLIDCRRGMPHVSLKTLQAVEQLKKQGDLLLIVSGRPKCLLDKDVLSLNPDGFIMSNGSYVEFHNEKIYQEFLNNDNIEKIITFGNRYRCPYYFETDSHVYAPDLNDPVHCGYFADWEIPGALKTYHHQNLRFNMAMIALRNDASLIDKCENYFNQDLIATRQGEIYGYDINVKGTSKGEGIRKFLQYLNIPNVKTYALGDGQNDISMMRAVDNPIGMGNACDILKKEVKYITSDVLDDGFYHALQHYKIIL